MLVISRKPGTGDKAETTIGPVMLRVHSAKAGRCVLTLVGESVEHGTEQGQVIDLGEEESMVLCAGTPHEFRLLIVEASKSKVKLGFDAPANVRILRADAKRTAVREAGVTAEEMDKALRLIAGNEHA